MWKTSTLPLSTLTHTVRTVTCESACCQPARLFSNCTVTYGGVFYLFISTQYPTTIVSSSKKPFLVFVELRCGTCVPAPLHHCPTFRTPEKIHYLRTDFLAWLPLCQWQVIFFSVLVAVTLDQGRLRLWQRNTRSSSTCPVSVSKKRCFLVHRSCGS